MKQISLAEVDQQYHQMKGSTNHSLPPSTEMHLQLHVHKLIHDFLFSSDGDHDLSLSKNISSPKRNGAHMISKEGNLMANQTWIWGENEKLIARSSNNEERCHLESSASNDTMTITSVDDGDLTTSNPNNEAKYDQKNSVSVDIINIITVKDQPIVYCDDALEILDPNSNHVSSVIEMEKNSLFGGISQFNTFQCGGKINAIAENRMNIFPCQSKVKNAISDTNEGPLKSKVDNMSEYTDNTLPTQSKANAIIDTGKVSCESKVKNAVSDYTDNNIFPCKSEEKKIISEFKDSTFLCKNNIRIDISDTDATEVKPSFRKPPRPPRLAISPNECHHPFLRCPSDVNLILKSTRKVRVDRRKGGPVTPGTNSPIWALVFTIFFAVAMIAQGSDASFLFMILSI